MTTKWKRVTRRFLHKARNDDEISVAVDRIRLPSSNEFDYVHVVCPYEVVFVVAVDKDNNVLLSRQHRYLVNEVLIEVPAGSPTKGETLIQAARREFEEESGYRVKRLTKLGRFYSSVGITNQLCHLFLGTGIARGTAAQDESEVTKSTWTPLDQAVRLVLEGRVLNVGAAYGILLAFQRSRETPAQLNNK